MSDTDTTITPDAELDMTPGNGLLGLPISATFVASVTGSAISRDEAADALRVRLEPFAPQGSVLGQTIADAIARDLPADALNSGVVAALDLRPYVERVASIAQAYNGSADKWSRNVRSEVWDLLGVTFVDGWGNSIDQTFVDKASTMNEMLQKDVAATYAESGLGVLPELTVGQPVGADPSGRAPIAAAAVSSGEVTVDEVRAWSVGASDDQFTQYVNEPVVSIGSIRAQFEAARSDAQAQSAITGQPVVPTFGTINQADSANLEANGGTGQVFPVATEGSSPTSIPESMPINQALLFLSRQTPEDVLAVQQQLAAAGYFDVLGATFTPKDRYDDATLAAWRMVVADSIVQNKPVMTVLADAKARRDATVTQRKVEARQAVSATDTGYMLDSWAQETLGRTLSAVEKQSLTAYVRNLAGDASQMSYGTNTEAEMATVAEAGYDQGALQDRLMETTFAERTSDQAMNLRQHMMSKYEALQDYIPEGGIDAGS